MALSKAAIWHVVHAERRRLADDLESVTGSQLVMPSLCPGWSLHDVLAHLVDTAETGRIAFVIGMFRARGDFDRANELGIERCKQADPQRTLEWFRKVTLLTRTPPAHPATRLVEAIVHGEDVRRPLHIAGDYPHDAIVDALAYQLRTGVGFGGGRERAEGLRLVDVERCARWGDGPEVSARAVDLLLAVSGRRVGADALAGPGAGRLLARAG